MKIGIVAFLFIISFVTIYGIIPNEFFMQVTGLPSKPVPNEWHGLNLYELNLTDFYEYNFTGGVVSPPDEDQEFSIGNRNLGLGYGFDILGDGDIRLYHRYGFLNLFHEDIFWYNQANELRSWTGLIWQNEYISIGTIDEDFTEFGTGTPWKSVRYACVNEGVNSGYPFDLVVFFAYNLTAYDTAREARTAGDLMILVGLTAENKGTASSAYDTLINLLTFNTLGLMGSNSAEALAINVLLAMPFYVAVVLVLVAIFLEVLPF